MKSVMLLFELLLGLATRLIDARNLRKKREVEDDLQSDVRDIKADPVDYARREYGGVPAEPTAPGVPGSQAAVPEDRKDE